MLAGAVVVHLARRLARADQVVRGLLVIGLMRAAAQRRLGVQPQLIQPCAHHVRMHLRALVRGAGQGQPRLVQPEGIRGTAFHQRQRLQHLA